MTTTETINEAPSVFMNGNELESALRRLCLPGNGGPTIDPLPITIKDGHIHTRAHVAGHPTYVWGSVDVGAFGEWSGSIDMKEFFKFLRLYGNEAVSVEFGDEIIFEGERRTVRMFSEAESPNYVETDLPSPNEDGQYPLQSGKVTTTTLVRTTAQEMRSAITDAKALGVITYGLTFGESSYIEVGSFDAKEKGIRTRIQATVEGTPVTTRIGAAYAHLFNNINGEVTIATLEGGAIVVEDSDGVRYLVSPRKD